jgi:crotonobetainyl-CoA:carnitine CoA-transferase CaiB-like acyl-CoA transferase
MAQLVLAVHLGGRSFEPPIGKAGYSRLLAPQRKPYRTQDGYVCALIYNDKQCESFFRAVGKPQLFTEDPRFATITARTEHISELYALVEEVLATRTTAEWVELLERADIPVMALNDLDGLIDDPHLAATGLVRESDHPTEGRLRSIGVPTRWSETQPAPSRPAPRLGEHSVEVLRECGYSDAAIAELVECGAVQMMPA